MLPQAHKSTIAILFAIGTSLISILSGCLIRAGASQPALNSQMSLAKPQSELTWGLPSLQKRYVPPDRSLDHSS